MTCAIGFLGSSACFLFAVHVTSKTANVTVLFSPSFLVVEGVSRIILSSSAIRARMQETGRELRPFQMIVARNACFLSTDYVRHRRCQTGAGPQHCNSDIRTRARCGQAECAYLSHARAVSSAQCCLGRGTPLNQARARTQKRRKMPLFRVEPAPPGKQVRSVERDGSKHDR